MKLAELFVDVGREGGVTDVGVDLAERLDAARRCDFQK
jgi:hypothetical protein